MKKTLNIAKKIIVWGIVAVAVCMMVFTIVSVSTFNRSDRSIFGYRAYIVLSDSMKKTDFAAGDLVLIEDVDPETLDEGDIIAYISQNTENFGETVTHKIRKKTVTEDGQAGFITYGTTTDTDDEKVVTYPYVIGKYKSHIPKIGKFFEFVKTTHGYIICILVPFLILILSEGIRCIRLFKKYKSEQKAEIDAERSEIEAERAEAQRMMAELLELKAQLSGQGASDSSGKKDGNTVAEVDNGVSENAEKSEEQGSNED